MIPRPLGEVADAVGGRVFDADPRVLVAAVTIDGRTAVPGSLFVALRGDHADGHAFADQAVANGAVAAIVSRDVPGPRVVVDDTLLALLALGRDERDRLDGVRVVAVTGSNGKTTTKDLAAAVLSTRFRTHASPSSFNNEIGLPITLLGAPEGVEAIVAEMGARRVGDVALLCDVARPDVVVVTNVGVAHMEIFGSWERIVASAAEPVEALGAGGAAVLNADDVVVRSLAGRTAARVLTFGTSADADVRADDVGLDDDARASFALVHDEDRVPVALDVPGEHMVSNALAAAAVGIGLGVTLPECAAALKGARIARWRMETFENPGGVVVVNDAYNANPESMAAALKAARWIARDRRLAAVLGHMAELGPIADDAHERLGELVVRVGVDRLVTVGETAQAIARAAIREGQLPGDVASYAGAREAADDVHRWARRGDVVLVKGSRVAGLERVAEALS